MARYLMFSNAYGIFSHVHGISLYFLVCFRMFWYVLSYFSACFRIFWYVFVFFVCFRILAHLPQPQETTFYRNALGALKVRDMGTTTSRPGSSTVR